jgi:predicted  nucleic acid-binding Zn-ribbon protein
LRSELERLFRLQRIDSSLYEKQRHVDEYENRLAVRRREIEACKAKLAALAAQRKELVSQRALAERLVSDLQEQGKERRQRVGRARNEKEHKASEAEMSSYRQELTQAEDALLALMEQVEAIEKAIALGRQEQAQLEQADHLLIAEEEDRIVRLKVELEQERAGRNGIAAEISATLRSRYETVLMRRGGQAVAEVIGGVCSGCHMQIPPQAIIEIRKGGAVRVCPSCQRILYVNDQPAS